MGKERVEGTEEDLTERERRKSMGWRRYNWAGETQDKKKKKKD